MALAEMIGSLIRELAGSEDITTDAAQTRKQLNSLYDLLLERMLDVSSYVRTKVLAVLVKLCDLPVKFPKQRLAMTRAAVAALEDKAAGVRKGAVGLLVKLTLTHPYGLMHGGLLGLEEWEERYNSVKAELEKVEGGMGNAVEIEEGAEQSEQGDPEQGQDEEESEDGEEETDGDASPKKRKKYVVELHVNALNIDNVFVRSNRTRVKAEDDMEVDESDGNEEDNEGEMEEGGKTADDDHDGDQATPKKSKAKKKTRFKKAKERRKSELDMSALTNEQAALAALESNQILHLRLRKKYYVEALNFIRHMEDAMEVICKLLGSTNKAEVLEAMEFFRVAYEYHFDGVEVNPFHFSCFGAYNILLLRLA